MNSLYFIIFYVIISCSIISVEAILAFRCLSSNNDTKKLLGLCSFFAASVLLSYSVTIFLNAQAHYFLVSLFSSFYFSGIDLTLLCFCFFTFSYTNRKIIKRENIINKILFIIVGLDVLSLLLNPFFGHVVHFQIRDTFIANYKYRMLPLFYVHLGISYSLVAISIFEIIYKVFMIPADYRKQYFYVIFGVSFIIMLNAIFLFFPALRTYNFLDYSIWGYGVAIAIVHWAAFDYPKKGMLDQFRIKLLENLNQGVVLFDYQGDIIIWNQRLEEIFSNVSFNDDLNMNEFLNASNLKIEMSQNDFTLQTYIQNKADLKPIRLDYSILKNSQQQSVGNIMVFSDYQMDIDMLTGFQSWENFVAFPLEYINDYCVVVIDINGLGRINKGLGKNEGDQIILQLSKSMRENFAKDTYFVRGPEAHLIAICLHPQKDEIFKQIEYIEQDFTHSFQYGISFVHKQNVDIMESIETATNSMREKKLMDQNSKHSNLLSSLIKALEECDNDTEAHVKRTQALGKQLGERIGLTDAQQSDLSLLCLLHDIGKIGIPLDILNKPGKLSESEWKVICSHVEKGYQIALSSPELEGIARMILHHHERWDGKGYPDGLSRESIPLLSRIISVVDAFDAMVNNRSYRKAMSKKEAMDEIRRCAGTQFDPSIASEFLILLESIDLDNDGLSQNGEEVVRLSSMANPDEDVISSMVHPVTYCRYLACANNQLFEVDEAFCKLTGYTKEEALNLNQIDLIPEEDQLEYSILVEKQLAINPLAYFEHRMILKDGSIINVLCSGRRYYDSSTRQEMAEIIVVDSSSTYSVKQAMMNSSSKKKNQMETWEDKYRRDSLTGLYNHEAFKNDVDEILVKGNERVMLIMIDVDFFKKFNDSYGHKAGDEFLIFVASCITSHIRNHDKACRMGGDEYACALLFEKNVDESIMLDRAKRLFDEISEDVHSEYADMTLSMGVFLSNDSVNTFNELYKKADKQLYVSKKNGRARIS